jgi:ceramide glucosyltransferase
LAIFGHILFYAGILGLLCSTGFLVLVIYSVIRLRFSQRRKLPDFQPPVTLLKPLHGLEPRLDHSLESFFQQDYPRFELIFGARHADDPALAIVERLRRKYPEVRVKIALSGEPDRPNAKVCSLEKMVPLATTDYYIFSDSDVHVESNYIREVMAPFADPQVGMVTCLYRGVPTGGLWSRLEALGMSVEMTAGVVSANTLEGMKFALGPTMAGRREAIERVGGMSPLADYCADDYILGNSIAGLGYKVLISQHVIDHIVLSRKFRDSVQHQVRWMKSTRFSRPKGHLGTALTFAMPFGVLSLLGGLLMNNLMAGLVVFAAAFLNRVLLSLATGWGVVRDPNSVRYSWLYPLRDFMGFCFWVASYSGRNVVWRGELYQLSFGGKMERVSARKGESGAVTIDHLA